MSHPIAEVQGTLQPDGTLVLDEKPGVPPGRVRVTVQPVVVVPAEDPFWQQVQAIWDSLKGRTPRTREEIDAALSEMDDEAEAEMQASERLHHQSPSRSTGGLSLS
jgi:hypothetical protein